MNDGPPRSSWQERWADPEFAPPWLSDDIDDAIMAAIQNGFFPARSQLLEIGCGSGRLAAFLAKTGFAVTAIDIARAAIDKAAARFGSVEDAPRFRALDFCSEAQELGEFDVALDRGCFHSLPSVDRPAYARNLARLIKPGGSFLLLHKVGSFRDGGTTEHAPNVEARVARQFGNNFEHVSTRPMTFGSGDRTIPGLAFRLRRL